MVHCESAPASATEATGTNDNCVESISRYLMTGVSWRSTSAATRSVSPLVAKLTNPPWPDFEKKAHGLGIQCAVLPCS